MLLVVAILALSGWIAYLEIALPSSYHAHNWNLAWAGFDFGMLIGLSITGWALWKKRQLAIPGAAVSSTFLVIDSWFDVITANSRSDELWAILSALFVQIPLALLLATFSRRAMKRSILNANLRAGIKLENVSMRKTPLALFEE